MKSDAFWELSSRVAYTVGDAAQPRPCMIITSSKGVAGAVTDNQIHPNQMRSYLHPCTSGRLAAAGSYKLTNPCRITRSAARRPHRTDAATATAMSCFSSAVHSHRNAHCCHPRCRCGVTEGVHRRALIGSNGCMFPITN